MSRGLYIGDTDTRHVVINVISSRHTISHLRSKPPPSRSRVPDVDTDSMLRVLRTTCQVNVYKPPTLF